MNKYQTLPGKRTKRSDLNGNRGGDGEYLSPVQLSPSHSQTQDYSLSEFWPQMQPHNIILKSSAGLMQEKSVPSKQIGKCCNNQANWK